MGRKHLEFKPGFQMHTHFKRPGEFLNEITVAFVEKDGDIYYGYAACSQLDPYVKRIGNDMALGRAKFHAVNGKEEYKLFTTDELVDNWKQNHELWWQNGQAVAQQVAVKVFHRKMGPPLER